MSTSFKTSFYNPTGLQASCGTLCLMKETDYQSLLLKILRQMVNWRWDGSRHAHGWMLYGKLILWMKCHIGSKVCKAVIFGLCMCCAWHVIGLNVCLRRIKRLGWEWRDTRQEKAVQCFARTKLRVMKADKEVCCRLTSLHVFGIKSKCKLLIMSVSICTDIMSGGP